MISVVKVNSQIDITLKHDVEKLYSVTTLATRTNDALAEILVEKKKQSPWGEPYRYVIVCDASSVDVIIESHSGPCLIHREDSRYHRETDLSGPVEGCCAPGDVTFSVKRRKE